MSETIGHRYEEAVGQALRELGYELQMSHTLNHQNKVDWLIVAHQGKPLARPVAIQVTFQVGHEYKMRKFTVACPAQALGLYAEIHNPWPTPEETVHHLVQTMEVFIKTDLKWLGLECRRGDCKMFNPRQRSNKMSHVRRSAHGRKSRLIGIITQAEQSYVTITIRGEPSREFRAFRSDLDDRRIRDHLDDDCPRQLIGRRVGFVPADRQVEWPPNSGRRHLHAREVRLAHSS